MTDTNETSSKTVLPEEQRNRLAQGRKVQTSIRKINYPHHWSRQRQAKSLSQGILVDVSQGKCFFPSGKAISSCGRLTFMLSRAKCKPNDGSWWDREVNARNAFAERRRKRVSKRWVKAGAQKHSVEVTEERELIGLLDSSLQLD